MFFCSVKEINRLLQEINKNRLLSKGIPSIYLKVTSYFKAPTPADIIEFSDFCLQFKNQIPGNEIVCGFSIVFILKGIMTL